MQETASRIAPRNCSEEVTGGGHIYVILLKGVRAVKHRFWQKVAASHKKVAATRSRCLRQ